MKICVAVLLVALASAQVKQLINDVPRREFINGIEDAPAAIGAYSQGEIMHYDGFSIITLSGQIGIDPKTGDLVNDSVEDQAEQAMKNVKALLEANGSNLQNIIKSALFILDMEDFTTVDTVYKSFFDENLPYPSRTAVAVHELPKYCKFEIQVEAFVEN